MYRRIKFHTLGFVEVTKTLAMHGIYQRFAEHGGKYFDSISRSFQSRCQVQTLFVFYNRIQDLILDIEQIIT